MVPEHIKEYQRTRGTTVKKSVKLTAFLDAKKFLLYVPMVRWLLAHGVQLTTVNRKIDYEPKKTFTCFVKVTEARQTGDVEKEKALLADLFKLLGNSAYGKLIEGLERQNQPYMGSSREV